MGRDSASGAGVRTHLRRGSNENTIHPLSVDTVESAPGPSHQLDQFRPFGRWFPWLVPSFIVANVSMFIITMFVNNCPKNTSTWCIASVLGRFSFQPVKENPLFGPSSLTLQKMGALDVEKIVERHQGWRLITCIWLHAGVIHLLANMLSLIFIGIRLEQEFGFMRIGLLYILSGFGGSLMSALFIQTSISVGASGALFGLLGGMLSELITNWTIYANKLAALLTLVFIIVVNLAMGILPHVDNFAHIGGFISGFLLGFVFLIRPQFGWISRKYRPAGYDLAPTKSKHKPYQYILWALALIVLMVWYAMGLIMLMRGVNANDHCSWCHYLTCVPTSRWGCKSESISCLTSQLGNQVNLTCPSNGQSRSYLLPDASSDDRIKQLCTQVCS